MWVFETDISALSETTSVKSDYIGCLYDGTTQKWYVIGYIKGY